MLLKSGSSQSYQVFISRRRCNMESIWNIYLLALCFNRQFLCTKPTAVSYFVVLMSLPPIAAIFVPFRTAMSSYKKHFIFKTFQIKNSHNLTYSMIFQRRQKIRENTVLIGHNCLVPISRWSSTHVLFWKNIVFCIFFD